jgi:hypothetical protein
VENTATHCGSSDGIGADDAATRSPATVSTPERVRALSTADSADA